jgi:hypothetical protein
MDIQLTNFRCFRSTDYLPIKPITLLVGENSAGKTSFQAAARYLLSSFRSFDIAQTSFNTPPFSLGGYGDIAYNRVGIGGGKSPSFTLTHRAQTKSDLGRHISTQRRSRHALPDEYTVRLQFSDWMGQPGLSHFEFDVGPRSIAVNIDKATVKLTRNGNSSTLHLASNFSTQFEQIRNLPRLLTFALSPLRFMSTSPKSSTAEVLAEPNSDAEKIIPLFADMFEWIDQALDAPNELQVVAISPIRTDPHRVYEFSETARSPTGSHVPAQLARQKLQTPETWKASRDYLVSFGERAGLFSNFDIRKLGKASNDPFQILITLGGNKRNIVDVGYGVSQVLPLLYEMSETKYRKLIMVQQPEVHLHPRAQAEIGTLIVDGFKKSNHNFIVETHSDFIIDRIRTEIRNERLVPEDVSLLYFERKKNKIEVHEIRIDGFGNLENPPKSYRSFFFNEEKSFLGIS